MKETHRQHCQRQFDILADAYDDWLVRSAIKAIEKFIEKDNTMRKHKVELLKAKKGYYWRLRWSNGKIACHSKTYVRKRSAEKYAQKMYRFLRNYPLEWEFIDRTGGKK